MTSIFKKILLYYLLWHINFNIFSPHFKNFLVVYGKRSGNYYCSSETTWGELRISTHLKLHIENEREDEFFVKTFFQKGAAKFSHTVDLPNGAKLIINNLENFEIPLKKVYKDRHGNVHNIDHAVKYILCPVSRTNGVWFYFREYRHHKLFRTFWGSNICSFGHCEIGLLFYASGTDEKKLEKGGTVNEGLYVVFTGGDEYPLLFYHPKSNGLNMALVACQYINWISKYSLSKFQPADFIKDFFPKVPYEDYDRHIFVPTFKYEKRKLPGNGKSNDQEVDAFICGLIKQKEYPDVEVGYKLQKSSEKTSVPLTFDGTKISCDSNDIKDEYVFGYLPPDKTILKKDGDLSYFSSEKKLYSGQYLLVYNKNEIIERRKQLLDMQKNHVHNVDYDYLAWDHQEKFYFNPTCIGTLEDVDATLKLKIGETIPQGNLMEDKKTISYEINKISESTTLSCHAIKDGSVDERYSNFYNKRFKTFIHKIEDETGKAVDETPLEVIKVIPGATNFYGKYKCTVEKGIDFKKIKSTEFVITSKFGKDNEDIIIALKTDKDVIKCPVKNERNASLGEMVVSVSKDKIYNYNYENGTSDDFKITHEYIILQAKSNSEIVNNTKFECIYKVSGEISSKKVFTIHIKNNIGVVDKKTKSFFIPIICGVAGFIILILIIVAIVTVLNIKKRKKSKLLSRASSATSASSMSRSKMSGLSSTSNSKSKSRFSNTKSNSKSSVSTSSSKTGSSISSTSTSKSKLSRKKK
uniref:Uncharacterized protein n=1 Tax=Strongyloides stercoralis TaxID=6248 RepID=A0A0K0EHJ7_STRER